MRLEDSRSNTFFDLKHTEQKMTQTYLLMTQTVCFLRCEDKYAFGIGAKPYFM